MSPGDSIRLGLIGWPLNYSASPVLHEAALAACGLTGEYRLYRVEPGAKTEGELRALVERVRDGELCGLNVTIPHKRAVLSLVDRLDAAAAAIGAVNVIARDGAAVVGLNTDAPGFLADLNRWAAAVHLQFPPHRRALVLGAGGAARAVAYALAGAGWGLTLAARRPEQAEALAADLCAALPAVPSIETVGLDATGLTTVAAPELVVNTTPMGMAPAVAASPWPDAVPWPAGAACYDAIYHPRATALVRRVRDQGLQATGGIGMLVEQAALAFERWTGRPAPRGRMREAIGDGA